MASIQRTYTLASGTKVNLDEIEAEIKNIVEMFNNHDRGILGWTGDITVSTAAKGMVVKTPDGLHTYRIAIDNFGQITSEQIT